MVVCIWGFPGGSVEKNPSVMEEPHKMQVRSLGWEHHQSLEKSMASHSSFLAWRIPWTEEPGGLQSIELQRAKHN